MKCPHCKKKITMVYEYYETVDEVQVNENGKLGKRTEGKISPFPFETLCSNCMEDVGDAIVD